VKLRGGSVMAQEPLREVKSDKPPPPGVRRTVLKCDAAPAKER
jgi:hypothetical protein